MKHILLITTLLALTSNCSHTKKQSALDGIIERVEKTNKKQCFLKLDSNGTRQGAYCLEVWTQNKDAGAKKKSNKVNKKDK